MHRLLKNSVGMNEYVLLTEAAQQDLQLPLTLLSKGVETYDGIGAVRGSFLGTAGATVVTADFAG